MRRSFRITIASYLVVTAIALTGCHDAGERRPELEIRVSPDTVRFDAEADGVLIYFVIRNLTEVQLQASYSAEVQSELSQGSWVKVADPSEEYVQTDIGGAVIAGGSAVEQGMGRKLGPGRYRLRMIYRRSTPSGATIPGMSSEALSNVFVVLP